jgi:release factor glutamine methyltransferase
MNFIALKQRFIEQIAVLYDAAEATSIFYLTVEKIANWNRSQAMLNQLQEVENLEQYEEVMYQLVNGKPIQHILQETWFYGLRFQVSADVLIPRVETEELIQWILEEVDSASPLNLLDIGTGSGCIAVTLKKNLPMATVHALDVSAAAISIAGANALANEVELELITSSILSYQSDLQYDLIVSNPPYIKEDEKEAMQANVLDHEPHQALFVSNENPLLFYKAIADFALSNLNAGGQLFFEINEYLGEETVKMLADKGLLHITLKKDMQGKDRMIYCRKSP